MDVLYQYGGMKFVWRADKAIWNIRKHDVRFEQACQVLLDPFVRLSDATADDEMRDGALGVTEEGDLLFVVHIEREAEAIRIILYPAVEAAKTCPTIDWKGVLSFQEVSPDG